MKNKIRYVIFSIIIAISSMVLMSCGNAKELPAPVVVIDGNVASWTQIDGAEKYEVFVDGEITVVDYSITSKKLNDGQTIKVRALSDGNNVIGAWSNEVTCVIEQRFTVTWKSDNTIIKVDQNIPKGTLPSYIGVTPEKESDERYEYLFTGWEPTIKIVEEDIVYAAVFTPKIRTYTIKWVLDDALIEIDRDVSYGEMASYDGITPYKGNTDRSTFAFSGWTPSVGIVTGDITYKAVFVETINKYTVTFYDETGDAILGQSVAAYGESTVFNSWTPRKEPTDEYEYSFAGWVTEPNGFIQDDLKNVIADRNVYAKFNQTERRYYISFSVVETGSGQVSPGGVYVKYNTPITVEEDSLFINNTTIRAISNENDAQYLYAFSGWIGVPDIVTSNITIRAKFTKEIRKYTVIWMDDQNILEKDTEVPYGTIPSYDGANPNKENTQQYSYQFDGWTPVVDVVKEDVTYKAQYVTSINRYTVTFFSEDGTTILGESTVNYGQDAYYSEVEPTKNQTERYVFVFEGWANSPNGGETDDLKNVIADRSVYAFFKQVDREYVLTINVVNPENGDVSRRNIPSLLYGTEIEIIDNILRVNGITITATPKQDNDQYHYYFNRWDGEGIITQDTAITASFLRQTKTYSVIWMNDETILETDDVVPYGTVPNYDGEIPVRLATQQYSYEFAGWEPTITTVRGNQTYIAKFRQIINQYTVTFYDETGESVLGSSTVNYGSSAVYNGVEPQKEKTQELYYSFDGWATEIHGQTMDDLSNVVEDRTVYAHFISGIGTYTITLSVNNSDYGLLDGEEEIIVTDVPFGTFITVENGTISIIEREVQPVAKNTHENYHYAFAEWQYNGETFNSGHILSDMTFIAVFYEECFVTYSYSIEDVDKNGKTIISNVQQVEKIKRGSEDIFVIDVPTWLINDSEEYFELIDWIVIGGSATVLYRKIVGTNIIDGEVYPYEEWIYVIDCVRGDLSIEAQYVRIYEVEFKDYDETAKHYETVRDGEMVLSPGIGKLNRYGYEFVGWKYNDNIYTEESEIWPIANSNIIFNAEYKLQYLVHFIDDDGTLLKEEWVTMGENGTPPINPAKTGYVFIGWDGSFQNITEESIISAQYQKEKYTVKFIIGNREYTYEVEYMDELNLDLVAVASLCNTRINEYWYDTNMNTIPYFCYKFEGWKYTYSFINENEQEETNTIFYRNNSVAKINVTSNMELIATYSEEFIEEPVLAFYWGQGECQIILLNSEKILGYYIKFVVSEGIIITVTNSETAKWNSESGTYECSIIKTTERGKNKCIELTEYLGYRKNEHSAFEEFYFIISEESYIITESFEKVFPKHIDGVITK